MVGYQENSKIAVSHYFIFALIQISTVNHMRALSLCIITSAQNLITA